MNRGKFLFVGEILEAFFLKSKFDQSHVMKDFKWLSFINFFIAPKYSKGKKTKNMKIIIMKFGE